MRKNRYLLISLLFIASTSISYADWDNSCLNACFKSGHDCRYCSYQCYSDNNGNPGPNYPGDSTCLLEENNKEANSYNYFNDNY